MQRKKEDSQKQESKVKKIRCVLYFKMKISSWNVKDFWGRAKGGMIRKEIKEKNPKSKDCVLGTSRCSCFLAFWLLS